jgi:hypothetical protein
LFHITTASTSPLPALSLLNVKRGTPLFPAAAVLYLSGKQRVAPDASNVWQARLWQAQVVWLGGCVHVLLHVLCRRMRDDLQQIRDKTVELEIKMDRVSAAAVQSSTDWCVQVYCEESAA